MLGQYCVKQHKIKYLCHPKVNLNKIGYIKDSVLLLVVKEPQPLCAIVPLQAVSF